jgi:hypothetical protein
MVNNEIRHGWEVTGGLISYTSYLAADAHSMLQNPTTFFVQAMIRSSPQLSQPK